MGERAEIAASPSHSTLTTTPLHETQGFLGPWNLLLRYARVRAWPHSTGDFPVWTYDYHARICHLLGDAEHPLVCCQRATPPEQPTLAALDSGVALLETAELEAAADIACCGIQEFDDLMRDHEVRCLLLYGVLWHGLGAQQWPEWVDCIAWLRRCSLPPARAMGPHLPQGTALAVWIGAGCDGRTVVEDTFTVPGVGGTRLRRFLAPGHGCTGPWIFCQQPPPTLPENASLATVRRCICQEPTTDDVQGRARMTQQMFTLWRMRRNRTLCALHLTARNRRRWRAFAVRHRTRPSGDMVVPSEDGGSPARRSEEEGREPTREERECADAFLAWARMCAERPDSWSSSARPPAATFLPPHHSAAVRRQKRPTNVRYVSRAARTPTPPMSRTWFTNGFRVERRQHLQERVEWVRDWCKSDWFKTPREEEDICEEGAFTPWDSDVYPVGGIDKQAFEVYANTHCGVMIWGSFCRPDSPISSPTWRTKRPLSAAAVAASMVAMGAGASATASDDHERRRRKIFLHREQTPAQMPQIAPKAYPRRGNGLLAEDLALRWRRWHTPPPSGGPARTAVVAQRGAAVVR